MNLLFKYYPYIKDMVGTSPKIKWSIVKRAKEYSGR